MYAYNTNVTQNLKCAEYKAWLCNWQNKKQHNSPYSRFNITTNLVIIDDF